MTIDRTIGFGDFLSLASVLDANLFRGQTRDHGSLTPSLLRGTHALDVSYLGALVSWPYLLQHAIRRRRERGGTDDDPFLKAEEAYPADIDWPAPERPEESWLDRVLGKLFPFGKTDAAADDETLVGNVYPRGPGHGLAHIEDGTHLAFSMRFESLKGPVALLQHYGVPTHALDVTFDPKIALWFATHRFVATGPQRGRYLPAEGEGVVYAIDAPAAQIADLRKGGHDIPVASLRGDRQSGALLFGADSEERDLSRYVRAKVTVTHDTFRSFTPGGPGRLCQRYLFPPGEEDEYYAWLLAAKTERDERLLPVLTWVTEYEASRVGTGAGDARP